MAHSVGPLAAPAHMGGMDLDPKPNRATAPHDHARCIADALGLAEAVCAKQGARLTPALARDLAAALERFADYADGLTAYVPTSAAAT